MHLSLTRHNTYLSVYISQRKKSNCNKWCFDWGVPGPKYLTGVFDPLNLPRNQESAHYCPLLENQIWPIHETSKCDNQQNLNTFHRLKLSVTNKIFSLWTPQACYIGLNLFSKGRNSSRRLFWFIFFNWRVKPNLIFKTEYSMKYICKLFYSDPWLSSVFLKNGV